MMTRKLVMVCALVVGTLTGCTVLSPPEKRVCGQVAHLCKLDTEAETQCAQKFPEMAHTLGEERTDRLAHCVQDAKSCAEASGCMAGSGLDVLREGMGDFLHGLKKTLP